MRTFRVHPAHRGIKLWIMNIFDQDWVKLISSGAIGTLLGGAVGVGISPVVQTSFNFADVGVNVDMTPKIHGRDEVSLHIDIELSNLNAVETAARQPH